MYFGMILFRQMVLFHVYSYVYSYVIFVLKCKLYLHNVCEQWIPNSGLCDRTRKETDKKMMNWEKHHLWILLRVPNVSSYTLKKNKLFFHMHIIIAYCNLPAINYILVLWQSPKMYSLSIVVSMPHSLMPDQSQLQAALKMKFNLADFTFPMFSFSAYSLTLPMSSFSPLVLSSAYEHLILS